MRLSEKLNDDDIDIIAKAALEEANPLYPVPKILSLGEIKEVIEKLKSN